MGRFLFGISSGLIGTICTRFTEETIPGPLFNTFGQFLIVFCALGVLVALIMAEILPVDTDKEALYKTEKWRIIYAYFPRTLMVVILIGLFVSVKNDSIKYLIVQNNYVDARKAVRKVYKYA